MKKGDILKVLTIKEYNINARVSVSIKANDFHFNTLNLEVFKGIECNALSKSKQSKILSTEYTISKDSNRMAYQVEEAVENRLESIITSLVLNETIQLTPSGKLLILMRDCQVTGGYSRIF